jgi:hypothetical protein
MTSLNIVLIIGASQTRKSTFWHRSIKIDHHDEYQHLHTLADLERIGKTTKKAVWLNSSSQICIGEYVDEALKQGVQDLVFVLEVVDVTALTDVLFKHKCRVYEFKGHKRYDIEEHSSWGKFLLALCARSFENLDKYAPSKQDEEEYWNERHLQDSSWD